MQKVHLFPCNNEISMCMYVFENESCSWLTTAWRVGKRWPLSALSPKRGNQSSAFNSERFVGRRTRADAEPRKAHKRHSEWTNRAPASLAVLYTGWVIKYSALPLNLGRFEPACFFSRRSIIVSYYSGLSTCSFCYTIRLLFLDNKNRRKRRSLEEIVTRTKIILSVSESLDFCENRRDTRNMKKIASRKRWLRNRLLDDVHETSKDASVAKRFRRPRIDRLWTREENKSSVLEFGRNERTSFLSEREGWQRFRVWKNRRKEGKREMIECWTAWHTLYK